MSMQQSGPSNDPADPGMVAVKRHINVQTTILQADGGVVTAGFTTYAAERALITRHRADGTLDPAFGTNGVVDTNFGKPGRFIRIYDMKAHNDGLVVTGVIQEANFGYLLLARFLASGALDPNFANAGVNLLRIGKGAGGDSLVVAGDRLYVGISASSPQAAGLVVFDGAGNHLKTTIVAIQHEGAALPAFGVQVDVDGAGRVVGSAYAYSNVQFAVALRFLANGSLDAAFHQQGYRVIEHPDGSLHPDCVAALPDNSVVIGGRGPATGMQGPLLLRLQENGVVTYLKPALPTGSTLAALTVHQGKLMIAGRANDKFLLARTEFDGQLDPSFGDAKGYTLDGFGDGWYQGARAIALRGSEVVCAGVLNNLSSDFWMGLMKHATMDGALDPAFGGDGKVVFNFP